MAFNPNLQTINFTIDLRDVDFSNRNFIQNEINKFIQSEKRFNTLSVSVGLTRENQYFVVAVIEFVND